MKEPNKMWYYLRVILNPTLWYRFGNTNKQYDKWLWNSLCKHGVQKYNERMGTFFTDYYTTVADKRIWIANSPYADGSVEIDGDKIYCSRITALLLREK